MVKSSKRDLLLLLVFFLFLIVSTYAPGRIVMGLDNASPYWGLHSIFQELNRGYNFFYTGPLLLAFPVNILSLLGIPASIVSHIFLYFCLFSGLYGILKLTNEFNTSEKAGAITLAFSGMTLVTIWLIANPSFLFLCAFASIPWIVTFLMKSSFTIEEYFFLTFAFFNFTATSINPVAFVLFSIQIIAIALLIRQKAGDMRSFGIKVGSLLIGVLLTLQLLLVVTKGAVFIGTELGAYAREQASSPINESITSSLRKSEYTNNTLTNVIRYATGWLQLSLPNDQPVFRDANLFRSNVVVIILQLIPYAIFAIAIYQTKSYKEKNYLLMLLALGFAYILPSSYIAPYLKLLPLDTAFRWLSSKLWPTAIILSSLLASKVIPVWLASISKRNLRLAVIILLISGFLPFFIPFVTKSVIPPETRVSIPPEYFADLSELTNKKTILVLKTPQSLYFRQYAWGYYGTDFLMYLTDAEIVDNATNNTAKLEKFAQLQNVIKTGQCPEDLYLLIDKPAILNYQLPEAARLYDNGPAFDLYQCGDLVLRNSSSNE